MNKRPATVEEYGVWLREELKSEHPDAYRNYYETVTKRMRGLFEESDVWKGVVKETKEIAERYYQGKGYPLFLAPAPPPFDVKPYESFVLKTFRKNVLQNLRFPEPPEGGWFTPSNWLSRTSDIVRSCLTVKYIDGVQFLVDGLDSYMHKMGWGFEYDLEAKEEGYYAAHTLVAFDFEIPNRTWDTVIVRGKVEVQVTTQLQETLRSLLHKHYERRRVTVAKAGSSWQWDYKSEEFATNYLGHILHYVEGMISELRDKH